MTQEARRAFSVSALDEARPQTHQVEAGSLEDAAFEFVELWHPEPDAEGEVSVMVTDRETGQRQCFRIDLGSGDSAPCS